MGVGIRVHRLRFPGRADRVRVSLGNEARLREVVGQVCGSPDRAGVGEVRASFETACEPLVEATTAPGQQPGLDDLAQQLMPEAEGAGRGLEPAARDGRARRGGGRRSPSRAGSSTSASRRSSTGRPATAAASTSAMAPGSRRATRARRTSITDRGSSASPAANSSSTNSGLPSERRQMRSATPGASPAPPIRRSWCSTASRSSRPSSSTTVDSSRSISASQARIGCPRGQVVHPTGQDDRQALRGEIADRNVTRSRVARSIQWTSSMTSTVGPAWDSAPNSPSMRSNSRAWPRPDGSVPGAGVRDPRGRPVRGQLRDDRREITARAGPSRLSERLRRDGAARARATPRRPGDREARRTRCRDTRRPGPALPARVPRPWPPARGGTCRSLPRPCTTTNRGTPAALASISRTRAATSPSRPTSIGLETRVDMATMVRRHSRRRARAEGAAPIGTAPSEFRGRACLRGRHGVGDHWATRVPFGPPDPPKRE